MEKQAPWKLVKTDKVSAAKVLYTAAEALRISALLLHPVMPNRTEIILGTLGISKTNLNWGLLKSGVKLKKHKPLFPRIRVEEASKKDSIQVKKEIAENVISYDDFQKVDLKTALILEAKRVKGADRLLKLQVEVGDEHRQIVAGLAEHYSTEELIGKMIVIVANLQPATIRGIESKGMLLAAKKGKELALITIDGSKVKSGMKIF
jgi:methionyl-tRNA synthetase